MKSIALHFWGFAGPAICWASADSYIICVICELLMKTIKALLWIIALISFGCSGNNENTHTTATTLVSPPPRQVLTIERRPSEKLPVNFNKLAKPVDPTKPLMIWNYASIGDVLFPQGTPIVIDFSLANAQLKGDGGQFRVRYIVDDEDMRWLDTHEQVVLTGFTPGQHTIRLELIGPDGWPYRNGYYNIETNRFDFLK